jgi:hypothetical protein
VGAPVKPVVLCPECVDELPEILERSESGDIGAKMEFERERAKILESLREDCE